MVGVLVGLGEMARWICLLVSFWLGGSAVDEVETWSCSLADGLGRCGSVAGWFGCFCCFGLWLLCGSNWGAWGVWCECQLCLLVTGAAVACGAWCRCLVLGDFVVWLCKGVLG